MWAPRKMDLARLREVEGLEDLHNRACPAVSPHVHPNLTHLSEVMEPAIEQVSEQVFNAVGFDVANATFVIGRDGVVVIDAMLAVENMAAALLAFREICEYPITALVYTHSHGDHWGGSPALVTAGQAASGEVPVIAQRQLMAEIARINGYNQPIMEARAGSRPGPGAIVEAVYRFRRELEPEFLPAFGLHAGDPANRPRSRVGIPRRPDSLRQTAPGEKYAALQCRGLRIADLGSADTLPV